MKTSNVSGKWFGIRRRDIVEENGHENRQKIKSKNNGAAI